MQTAQENGVAPIPQPGSNGNGKADQVSTSGQKSISPPVWVKVGRLEALPGGVKITFTIFGTGSTVYLVKQDIRRIVEGRFPGDLVTITETPQEIITSNCGRAFRSRTGRAIIFRTPYYSGDMMTSWQAFQNVLNGSVKAAPVSIIQTPTPARDSQQNTTSALSRDSLRAGLQVGF